MIYIISDPHGDINFTGLHEYIKKASENDWLIILGDICFDFEKTEENRKFTEFFMSIDKNIAFLDGNHDNFDIIKNLPEEEWMGGKVGRLTKNIIHLKRGNVYTIEGKTFFTFGGCKSGQKWKDMGLWYPEEAPTDEEVKTAYENLEKHGRCVDYVLTHKYEEERGNFSEQLLEIERFIEENVEYKMWYCGHGHANRAFTEKRSMVFDVPIIIE